jgi:hypothetical protein
MDGKQMRPMGLLRVATRRSSIPSKNKLMGTLPWIWISKNVAPRNHWEVPILNRPKGMDKIMLEGRKPLIKGMAQALKDLIVPSQVWTCIETYMEQCQSIFVLLITLIGPWDFDLLLLIKMAISHQIMDLKINIMNLRLMVYIALILI